MDNWPPKDPDEVLDYQVDWTDRLEEGETISDSEFLLADGDVDIDSIDEANGITTVWLSGGTLGTICVLTNRITTSEGRTYDKSVRLRIKTK